MLDITVQELKHKLDNDAQLKLIDVREPYEHEDFNIGGDLIPMGSIPQALQKLEPYKEREVVVYCRSGQRSGMIKEFLKQAGFTNVRNLLGGILHWQDEFGKE